jgi:hypothetical protein
MCDKGQGNEEDWFHKEASKEFASGRQRVKCFPGNVSVVKRECGHAGTHVAKVTLQPSPKISRTGRLLRDEVALFR